MKIIEQPIFVLSILFLLVLISIYIGKSKLGSKFGAALIVIIITAIVANLGIIPTASNSIPLYEGIFKYIAPISIFYLMLGVNLKSIKKAGGPMIALFLIGSFATCAGVALSYIFISPQSDIGEEMKILSGMFTGTYTGGSINFNAIALEYDFQNNGILYAGAIAVDSVIGTIWIVLTLGIPTFFRQFWKDNKKTIIAKETHVESNESLTMSSLMWLAFLGTTAFFLSELFSDIIPSILVLTTLGISLAQFKFIKRIKGSHTLGLYLIYLFLAVIGAYCEINAVIGLKTIGVTLVLFATVIILVHGIIMLVLGGLFYRDWDMIAIASQANVGGATTAIALAETFKRPELIVPAILVGTLGNALGTYLGFAVIWIL